MVRFLEVVNRPGSHLVRAVEPRTRSPGAFGTVVAVMSHPRLETVCIETLGFGLVQNF